MSTTTVFTGDTIRLQGTFKNLSNTLTDADGNTVNFKAYDADTLAVVATGTTTRSSTGVYYYDWLVPSTEKAYFLELSGAFSTLTQLKRTKVKAKFKGTG